MNIVQRFVVAGGLFLALFPMLSCGGGGGSASPRQWTYMVYMGADNNLSTSGLIDLNEMETVGSSDEVAIVVQAEFSTQYTQGMPTSDAARIYVENDNNPSQVNLDGDNIDGIGNTDMANPASLTAFITWAKNTYPAEHYALVVWDHGAGWKAGKAANPLRGAVQDETSGTFMSLPDLAKAVADSGLHFDIVNFDACLMAMYEVAYEFKDLTDFLVFSEETEPGEGDPYDTILGALDADPQMTAQSLAEMIVAKYDQYYATNDRGSTTKSAVDMTKLAALDAKVLALAAALKSDGSSAAIVQQAQSNTQEYAYAANHDLWHFSSYLANSAAGTAVKAAAADVKAAVAAMVIANLTNGSDTTNSHGLAIFLPKASETNAGELANYALLAANKAGRAAAANTWGSYLEGLVAGSGGGTATYHPGGFGVRLEWTNASNGPCDADLDLYVWEPAVDFGSTGNGEVFAPWMGQTTPNGYFSPDSYDSGIQSEYYAANEQVVAGDYYFLVRYYADGPACTQAKARLYLYDPLLFSANGPDELHELTVAELGIPLDYPSPQLLDDSNVWPGQALGSIGDLNNYSDWWVPIRLTKAAGVPQLSVDVRPTKFGKQTQILLRYNKSSRLF